MKKSYKSYRIYNIDLNKYWKSGTGWIDSPDKASRFRGKSDAEFVKNLFIYPHAGEPRPQLEQSLEVHTFLVTESRTIEKI